MTDINSAARVFLQFTDEKAQKGEVKLIKLVFDVVGAVLEICSLERKAEKAYE